MRSVEALRELADDLEEIGPDGRSAAQINSVLSHEFGYLDHDSDRLLALLLSHYKEGG